MWRWKCQRAAWPTLWLLGLWCTSMPRRVFQQHLVVVSPCAGTAGGSFARYAERVKDVRACLRLLQPGGCCMGRCTPWSLGGRSLNWVHAQSVRHAYRMREELSGACPLDHPLHFCRSSCHRELWFSKDIDYNFVQVGPTRVFHSAFSNSHYQILLRRSKAHPLRQDLSLNQAR